MIPLWKSELHVYPAHISQKSFSVTNISFNWQTSVLGTIALGQSNCKHSFCTSFHCAQVIVILYQVSLSSMFPKLSGVTAPHQQTLLPCLDTQCKPHNPIWAAPTLWDFVRSTPKSHRILKMKDGGAQENSLKGPSGTLRDITTLTLGIPAISCLQKLL